ncbi:MAG: STAS domain-containing protein [Alphaproteobacteria bacterium]
MNLRQENTSGVGVMILEGRLDANSADQFQNGVLGRVGKEGGAVLLDLSALSYLSSAGIRSILIIARELQAQKRGFAMCGASGGVEEVLSVSGVDSIVTVHETRDAGVQALA